MDLNFLKKHIVFILFQGVGMEEAIKQFSNTSMVIAYINQDHMPIMES